MNIHGAIKTLGDIAAKYPVFVRRATGRTFVDRLNALRLAEAARRLRSTPRSIAEISAAVGFASPAYFNRQFRRLNVCSPRDWRKRGDPPQQ